MKLYVYCHVQVQFVARGRTTTSIRFYILGFKKVLLDFTIIIITHTAVGSVDKKKAFHVTELTCIVQSSGDYCDGPVSTELGHAAVSLHCERVVQMRI